MLGVAHMDYKLFDLGINGQEVKRRLNMLKDITNGDQVATEDFVNEQVMSSLNVNEENIAYLDAGKITDLISN